MALGDPTDKINLANINKYLTEKKEILVKELCKVASNQQAIAKGKGASISDQLHLLWEIEAARDFGMMPTKAAATKNQPADWQHNGEERGPNLMGDYYQSSMSYELKGTDDNRAWLKAILKEKVFHPYSWFFQGAMPYYHQGSTTYKIDDDRNNSGDIRISAVAGWKVHHRDDFELFLGDLAPRLADQGYPSFLGYIKAEDQYSNTPEILYFDGDARIHCIRVSSPEIEKLRLAVELPYFWQWGAGGKIVKATVETVTHSRRVGPPLTEKETHQKKLDELGKICTEACKLVDSYFKPPNLMAVGDTGTEWEVFIRRKGSDAEFGATEWRIK